MSLIDPNQIISLAPSQNVGQPTVPFAPGSATAAVYDRDLDQDVAGSIMQAGTYDPTAAAKAIRLSQETRIPFPLAQNNYDDLAHRQKITAWQQTVSQNPTLAPLLRDPEFAAVAQDDSQNVGWWTRFKSSVADLNKAREDWWFETTKDIATGGMIGFRVAQRGQVGARMMDSEITPEDRETIRKADADLKAFQRPASFFGSAAELIGQQVVTVPEALREAAVGATAGGLAGAIGGPLAPATMAGGMALGATAGLATGFARQAYRVEAGNAYVDMIDKGVEPDTAYPVAMGIGLVNASLELGGASFVAKPFQQAFRLAAKNAINEAIIQPTTRQALRAAGASYVKAIGAETSTEVMQEVVTMVGEEAAMLASGIDSELTAADAAKRVVDTAIHTAMGMAVLGVPGAGVTLYSGMRASARTQREQNALTQIAQNAKDTKFRADAPTVYERLAATQLNGTSAETTYIDAERVKEVLDQAGLTPAEIDQVLPGVRQQLPDALASRGDVTIPTAKWAANTVGTKIEAALLPHMRLSATSMSPVEAAVFQAEREQLVAEASQILEQKQAVDAEWTRQAKDIADTIRQQAVAVRGMTETDADVFASGVQAFYVTKAVEMGMTPEQLFRLAPYTIQGEAAGVSLEQADQFDQAGQRRTDTPEFKTWSNDAPVIANEQSEAHEFTTGTPVVVEALHGSTERGLRRFDVGRAVEVPGAIFFTSNPAVAEQYAYERAYGDIISDQPTGDVIRAYVAFANPMVYQPKGKVVDAIEMGRAIEQAKAAGHDGIIIKNIDDSIGMTGDMGDVYVTWNPTSIKSVNNHGTWSRTTANIMEQAATMDADYMAAVERGDMDTARRMVDEAAKAAGFTVKAFHGSASKPFWVFDPTRRGERTGSNSALLGFFASSERQVATEYQLTERERRTFNQPTQLGYGLEAAENEQQRAYDIETSAIQDAEQGGWLAQITKTDRFGQPYTYDDGFVYDTEAEASDAADAERASEIAKATERVEKELARFQNEERELRAGRTLHDLWVRLDNPLVYDFRGGDYRDKSYSELVQEAIDNGHDGVIMKNTIDSIDSRTPSDVIVFFNSNQAKLADPITRDEAGNVIPLSRRFDITSPRIFEQAATMDAEYLAAVERGDMETAQRMVDEAADAGGFTIEAFHGTPEGGFTEFRDSPRGLYFTNKKSLAAGYTYRRVPWLSPGTNPTIYRTKLRMTNPLRIDAGGARNNNIPFPGREYKRTVFGNLPAGAISVEEAARLAFEAGHDGIIIDNILDSVDMEDRTRSTVYVIPRKEQVKSADPITRDEAGNVVPLSRRFDVTSPMMYFQSPVTPAFYSALEREVNAIDAKALPASGWSERFKGLISKGAIKADELEWSGLADYLKMQEGKVSKDAVLEFLRGNGVRVERVTLGNVEDATIAAARAGTDAAENALIDANLMTDDLAQQFAKYRQFIVFRGDSFGAEERAAASERINTALGNAFGTDLDYYIEDAYEGPKSEVKYEGYTLPGGRNYREVLLALPAAPKTAPIMRKQYQLYENGELVAVGPDVAVAIRWSNANPDADIRVAEVVDEQATTAAARKREKFVSTHWDQPNVLVHLRMNDRVDADGKRVLFVEEVQSDWGQAGVKYGFVNQRAADEAELANLLMQQETKPSDALKKQIARVQARIKRGEYNVFRAPYVETTDGWLNLGLKQVLLEAVRGNYDRVAFVTGQQSADRYDLSKQVDSIVYRKTEDGKYNIEAIKDSSVLLTKKAQSPSDLEDVLGKDVAKRIIDGVGEQPSDYPAEYKELAGVNLKVGGEGMKSFYDKIVPDAVNKLLKKYGGGKIGQIGITEQGTMRNLSVHSDGTQYWLEFNDGTRASGNVASYLEADAIREQLESGISKQPGFDVTPELVKKLESGLPLFQAAAASGPRGGFDPRTLTTFINKGGDLSTWIHETAHFHFTVLGRLASRADAPESIRADMDTLLQWGKVDGATPEERLATWNAMTVDQQRKLHEQFAYSWEVYQFEGKAPSVEMQGVFERFRMWLMRVYKSVLEINAVYRSQFGEDLPALTPEVRQVMDRMLATQEQIERQQAINQMIPSFQSQDESGMSDAEWAAYQKMQAEATEAAVTDLGKASLSQMEWLSGARSRLLKQMQTRNAKARREMRDEVSRQVRSDPTYRALRYIRTGKIEGPDGAEIVVDGPHKLSTAGVREIIDALPMDRMIDLNMLPEGVMAENGRDPDLVAADFGFDSGDALLRAMVGMRSLEDEINARTDARLLAENALMSPEQMEEEVQRAIHNEARARFVAVEQRWLERLDRPARIILEAAKQAARAKVAGTLVRDLRPQQWIAAESRAARDARLAYSNRRTPEEIGRSVYTRVYNEQEAAGTGLVEAQVIAEAARVKAVADAQARLDAFRAAYPEADPAAIAIRAKRAQTYNNQMAAQTLEAKAAIEKAVVYLRRVLRAENRKKMGADYADQIEGILERFDLAAIGTEKARARQALAEWLEGERKKGLDPELPPVIADEAERKPYKNMTVAEFRELADAVRTLEYMGKNTTKILLAGKRLEFEATRDRIVENGEENAERRGRKAKPPVSVPTKLQRRIEAIRGYHTAQLTPSAIIQTIDGGEDGPLSRYLLEPFAEQANFQTEQRVRATEFLDKTLRPIIKSPRNRPIVIDSIGRSMQLEERLVVALNYGNDGNARRLLVGEDWTEAQVADILATLTKAELEAVQKIWDFFETFRPMISAKERRLTGKDLEYVDRRELTVPRTADGQSVTLPGGYYPIRYDPRRSTMVQAIDEVEEAKRMMDGARTASTTSDTFKKKRSQNGLGKPLTLTMNALYSGVNEVIDDLSWQEWLIAANRLMRDGKFAKMVRERYGDAYYQQLREWISTVAVGDRVASSVVENMAVAVRQNVSVSAMAWRAMTAGIQITGIFPAAAKIGTINTLRGLTYLMTSPRQASERAREKSKFMANRGRTRYRDLNEIRNLVRGETGIRRNYMATAYAAIGAMQSISDNTAWWGRYEAAKRDGRDENTAVFLADQAVKDTQGSGLTGDLSSVMRGGKAQSPYVKLFTSFMQYSNTMYSLTSERAMTANGRGDLAARLFLILIPGAILEELIRNLLTAKAEEDEPEELVRRLAANQLDYLISLPFGIRELTGIGDVLLGVEPRYQYRGPSGLRAISATGQLVNELSQGEFDAGLRRALINFVGITTGAPSTQINATIDGINAVMEGEAEGADVILAPITGFKTR